WLIEHSTSHQLLWCIDSFVLRNPPLRQAPNRSGEIPSGSRQIALEALPSEALSGTSHIRRFCKMQNTSQSLQCVVCNLTKPMKPLFLIIFFLTFLACNFKKDSAVSKIKNPNPEKVIQEKLSGKEVVAELEKLGYFNLTNESELDTVKADFQKAYTDLHFFQGPMRGETLNFMDNRYQWV